MSIEQTFSHAALDLFAVDATLNGVAVKVIIDRNVEIADTDGNVRHIGMIVNAKTGTLPVWNTNDVLTSENGNLRLNQLIEDDGFIQKIEARPVA